MYQESLALRQKLGDKRGIAILLNQLGVAVYHQKDYPSAARLHEESLTLQSELTDKAGAADSYYGLSKVAAAQGDHAQAYKFLHRKLGAAARDGRSGRHGRLSGGDRGCGRDIWPVSTSSAALRGSTGAA